MTCRVKVADRSTLHDADRRRNPQYTLKRSSRILPRIGGVIPMYVDGEWKLASDGGTRELVNPSNGESLATIAEGGADDTQAAISAARKAFDEGPWAQRRRRRPSGAALESRRRDRRASRRVRAHRHAQQRQAAARDPSTMPSTQPTASATTRASRPSRTAKPSTYPRRRKRSPCANRSASAGRSCRGTIRC